MSSVRMVWVGPSEKECDQAHKLLSLAVQVGYMTAQEAKGLFEECDLKKVKFTISRCIDTIDAPASKAGHALVCELMLA